MQKKNCPYSCWNYDQATRNPLLLTDTVQQSFIKMTTIRQGFDDHTHAFKMYVFREACEVPS